MTDENEQRDVATKGGQRSPADKHEGQGHR